MNKTLSILLILAMMLTLFASCGGSDPEENDPYDDYIEDDDNGYNDDNSVNDDNNMNNDDSSNNTNDDSLEPSEDLTYRLYQNEDIYSTLPDEFYIVTGSRGGKYASTIVIPDEYQGIPVCSIDERAFEEYSELKTVVLPKNLLFIGNSAFLGCTALKEINLPASLDSIGNYAFWFSGITKLNIPATVTYIGEYAFMNTPLQTIQFKSGSQLNYIGNNAFQNCYNLKEITIPEKVLTIGESAFNKCTALKKVTLNCAPWEIGGSVFDGCTALTELVLSNNLTTLPPSMLQNSGIEAQLETQDGLVYYKDMLIGVKTAQDAYTVREGTRVICDEVFRNSKLVSITLPNSLETIGKYCFTGAAKLSQVTFGNKLKTIMQSAFFRCSALETFTLPTSVEVIGMYAFEETGYFENRNNWDDVETAIGISGSAVLYHQTYLLSTKWLRTTEYTVKDGTLILVADAITDCDDLEKLILPNSVKRLNPSAINFVSTLKEIHLGNGLEQIDSEAIYGLDSLSDIYFNGTKAEWNAIPKGENWLSNHPTVTLHCSDGDIVFESDFLE